jgi:hypothetical protein
MIQFLTNVIGAYTGIKLRAAELRQQRKPAAIVERLLREQIAMAEAYREKLDALHKYHADLESQRMREAFERGTTLRELLQDDMRQGIENARREFEIREESRLNTEKLMAAKEDRLRKELEGRLRDQELGYRQQMIDGIRSAQMEAELRDLKRRPKEAEEQLAAKAATP